MDSKMLGSMRIELEKLARVHKAVKMYRRATQALASGKYNFHGTKPQHVKDIAESGMLLPAEGTHGVGAYMWKGAPHSTYMRYPNYPGVIAPRHSLQMGPPPIDPTAGRPLAPGLYSERSLMDISSTPVQLPPKVTMLSATPEELAAARGGMQKNQIRPIDSAIFHRAEADAEMRRVAPFAEVEPTKKELADLYARKVKPPVFGKTRGRRTDAELDAFTDQYEAATSR